MRKLSSVWNHVMGAFCAGSHTSSKLALFRTAFFSILAVDMWLQISHAPRYGAGNFNVPQLQWLDFLFPTPSRSLMLVLYLTMSWLAVRLALGLATRLHGAILALLFGYSYFVSHLNSYQHHYLLFLVLVALAFFDFSNKEERKGEGYWPIRLVLIQVSIVYAWAVVTKLSDPTWLDGVTISLQVKGDWLRHIIETRLAGTSPDPYAGWSEFAWSVVLSEAFLAVAIHVRRLRTAAFFYGIVFHLTIEFTGFKIGLFSYFMAAIYLLCMPDFWVERGKAILLSLWRKLPAFPEGQRLRLALSAACLLLGVACLAQLPYPEKWWLIGISLGLAGMDAVLVWRRSQGLRVFPGYLAAGVALLLLFSTTATTVDYYRFWGSTSRRFGPAEDAVVAYEKLMNFDADNASGNIFLGIHYATEDPERALPYLEKAAELRPTQHRIYLAQARAYENLGRSREVVQAARRAQALKPGSRAAKQFLRKHSPSGK